MNKENEPKDYCAKAKQYALDVTAGKPAGCICDGEPPAELPEILRTMAAALGTIHQAQQKTDIENGEIRQALHVLDATIGALGKTLQKHEIELVKLGELVLKHQTLLMQATGQPRTKPAGELN